MSEQRPNESLPSTQNSLVSGVSSRARRGTAILLVGLFLLSALAGVASASAPGAVLALSAPHAAIAPVSLVPSNSPSAASSAAPTNSPSNAFPWATPIAAPEPGPSASAKIGPSSLVGQSEIARQFGLSAGFDPSHLTAPSPLKLSPHAFSGSLNENTWVQSVASESSAVQRGTNSNSFAETSTSTLNLINASLTMYLYTAPNGDSNFLFSHGLTDVSVSTDGGQTWTNTWPGVATAWQTSGSPSLGDITTGVSTLASDTSGDLFLSTTFGQTCFEDLSGYIAWASNSYVIPAGVCNSTAGITAPSGIAFSEMAAGGLAWSTPVVLTNAAPDQIFPEAAGACGAATAFLEPANVTYGTPQILSSANGADLTVVYNLASYSWAGGITCNTNTDEFQAPGETFGIGTWATSSTDGGTSWSAPVSLSGNASFTPSAAIDTVGTGPMAGEEFATWLDAQNATAYAGTTDIESVGLDFTASTDGGSTWAVPTSIGGSDVVNFDNVSGDGLLGIIQNIWTSQSPSIAVDNWSSSPYQGNLYITWGDNRSSEPGDPSAAIVVSTDGGSTWSSPVFATPDSLTESFFAPQVAVQANGNVWVTVMGFNTSGGVGAGVQEFAVVSSDGGASWSQPFPVSDTPDPIASSVAFLYLDNYYYGYTSGPTSGIDGAPLGPSGMFGYPTPMVNGVVGTQNGILATWTDCRDATYCQDSGGNTSIEAAQALGVTFNASGTMGFGWVADNLTVSSLGQTTVVPMTATTAGILGLDAGAGYTVSAPTSLPTTQLGVLFGFSEFAGLLPSSTDPASGTLGAAAGQVEAIYATEPAGWIAGTVGPASSNPKVTVEPLSGGTLVTLPLTLGTDNDYTFNDTVPAGATYTVSASAKDYNSTSSSIEVNAGQSAPDDITLAASAGYLNDTILNGDTTPFSTIPGVSATLVSTGGTPYPFTVAADTGLFHIEAPWGTYTLTVTATGMTSYSASISLPPDASATLKQILLFGSHIDGILSPITATVMIDGVVLGHTGANYTDTNWNWTGLAGTHWVQASAPGYNSFSQNVSVSAGINRSGINIELVNHGWYVGSVDPTDAIIYAGTNKVAVTNGNFNESLTTGSYKIEMDAAGYNPYFNNVTIAPGVATFAGIVKLVQTNTTQPGNCTTTNTCQTTKNNSSSPANNDLLLYAGLGIVALAIVLVAVLLLTRRGGGRPGGGNAPEDGATDGSGDMPVYDEGSPPSGGST